MGVESTHVCTMCTHWLSEEQCQLVDNLSEEENKLADDENIFLIYIAGYITRKDLETQEDTFLYYEKYGSYIKQLDRGGLKHASDFWVILSSILFDSVRDYICQKSLTEIFYYISKSFRFIKTSCHWKTLTNILINNYCKEINYNVQKGTSTKSIKTFIIFFLFFALFCTLCDFTF